MSHHINLLRALKQPYHWAKAFGANVVFGFPSKKLRIIGVTGTDGKTTTSTMIYHILKSAGKKVALVSTVAAYIGEDAIDTGFHVTSPEPFALQRLMKKIATMKFEFVVLEATSHGIFQHRLLGIKPEVAVLTNITHEHLDYHASFDEYVRVKTSFLARAKVAYVNKLDGSTKRVKELLYGTQVIVKEYETKSLTPQARTVVTKKFIEQYNRENAAAAVSVAEYLGVSEEICLQVIEKFEGVVGRMNEINNSRGISVFIDFAHTPNALEGALKALRSRVPAGKKLIAVFGAAGLRDHTKRPMMGRIASELADEVVLTAEDPRTENVWVIIQQIKAGATKNYGHLHGIADRGEAIEFAINTLANKGDIIGIFGKGHEKSMNLDGKKETPWSDHEAAGKSLAQKGR